MIKIENLSYTYPKTRSFGEVVALKNLNEVFEDDSFNVILGPSGCGKTTLLNCLAGINKYEGNIYFDDVEGRDIAIADRNMSLVSQRYVLYPHMTIFDNIAFPLKNRGASKQEIVREVNKVAEFLELDFLLTRKPKELSGGQQQRVALARALVKKPTIFLFDEPLSNVSEDLRKKEKDMIKKAVREYHSMAIYITHNLGEATSLADKLFIMKDGEIVIRGKPLEVLDSGDEFVNAILEDPHAI